MAVGGPGFLRIHDVDPVLSRYAPGGEVTGIALAAEGIRLAAVAGAGKVTVFQAGDGEVLSEFETAGTVSAVAFDPDGGRYATGGADGVVRVRETISGRLRRFPHEGPVNALIFTGSGLLTCSSDRTVRLLSVTGDEIAETWPYRHTRPVNLLAASPDGRWAAFAGADHAVVVLDDGGREVCRVQHDQRVSALSFGALVASGSADGTVRLMDPRLGRQVAEVSHPASVTAVAISPDGSLLVTADLNGAVRVYDTTGDPPEQVQQVTYPDTVTGLVFHPADRRLAVIAETSSVVRIIDPLDGTEAVRLPHPAPVQRLTFSRNGELLATACADDVVRIFPGSWA